MNLAAVGTQKGSVLLWDMDMGCLRSSLGDHHAPITNLVFTSIVKHHAAAAHPAADAQHHAASTNSSRSPVNGDRPVHALHTAHRPSHFDSEEQHHHPLPKHHPSFIQAHHHQGSANYPHEQISHGVVRLVSTSNDGVVHLWATMPHRVVKGTHIGGAHGDKNTHKAAGNHSRQSQRGTPQRSTVNTGRPGTEQHGGGIHTDPSPVLHYDQDDGSGLLEPILLKVS